jgi:hypothetical protein
MALVEAKQANIGGFFLKEFDVKESKKADQES